jgi:hypothetical protein
LELVPAPQVERACALLRTGNLVEDAAGLLRRIVGDDGEKPRLHLCIDGGLGCRDDEAGWPFLLNARRLPLPLPLSLDLDGAVDDAPLREKDAQHGHDLLVFLDRGPLRDVDDSVRERLLGVEEVPAGE